MQGIRTDFSSQGSDLPFKYTDTASLCQEKSGAVGGWGWLAGGRSADLEVSTHPPAGWPVERRCRPQGRRYDFLCGSAAPRDDHEKSRLIKEAMAAIAPNPTPYKTALPRMVRAMSVPMVLTESEKPSAYSGQSLNVVLSTNAFRPVVNGRM